MKSPDRQPFPWRTYFELVWSDLKWPVLVVALAVAFFGVCFLYVRWPVPTLVLVVSSLAAWYFIARYRYLKKVMMGIEETRQRVHDRNPYSYKPYKPNHKGK